MAEITLKGKRALVTGAASGIGRAIATKFAEAGAEVFVLDLKADAAEKAAAEIAAATGSTCHALAADVSDEAGVAAAFAALPGSKLDVLVNSAGIAHVGSIETTSTDDFDRLYKVNVRGTFFTMQEAVKLMAAAKSGVILNLASIAATSGLSQRFAYSMTKGAVLAMTLSVAKDCLPHGIRCNCISPARVHTPFVDGFLAKNYPGREAEMMATLAAAQPIGRMGTPAEIADLALYLCSDAASFITGVDMLIDGGYTNLR
ncbi:SDR family NAD(P)-dependent oxidoreductase [Silvibacterium dinghuense]|uniref:SDR family oxidoreductase n=1 Tax=Silvibacterium dinghuense TaxID=1560006 RepID=A0A4Q1SFW4_9BACT|nr:SDR family oxidoreductase [Silvibacterium dinghuense]RXS96436.1 SDR family oxidoreductase [Silvibacterium dinghuense]GGG90744.1 NAD(P)-dependent oxidoreductase [Silvibacterium dinghuense]